ncbi:hypothetical protein AVEN_260253-1 [Araneus ventricosus]|uniref:Uncharacterized protein n=1 Tax=Araneus ventricosus TaxID=182803 RepID=A0A4Y1ZMJ4_ARAVE|nr:hypothetical protein AVEN_260253-1 [Araneus ventricosus]
MKVQVQKITILSSAHITKQAHFYERPKRMKLYFRRPDLRSQRPKSILLPPRKSSPWSSLSSSEDLFQKSPRSLLSHSLLTPSSSSWGNGPEKSLQQITVNSVGGVQLSHYWLLTFFGPVILSQAVSQAGDILPFSSRPLKSRPLAPDWTPGSVSRRVNEGFPLRHLLCPLTHGF